MRESKLGMPKESSPPSLAAIVPATDGPPTLECCLEALRRGERPPNETIVESEPAAGGPAAARNRAAAQTGADVLVFVDADVAVHGDALARIANAFGADRDLDAVFGAYDDAPTEPGLVSRFRNLLHHHVHAAAAGPATTFWSGLGAVRRERFLAAGGFDSSRYPVAAIEDVELGMRLHADGRKIVLDPAIRGTHLKRWTLRSMVTTDFRRRGLPWARLQLERRDATQALNLGWRHRLSALACVGGAIGLAGRRPALAAGSGTALVALNHRFYTLLARRGGARLLAAGVPLHVAHHLTSVAAAGTALASWSATRP